MIRSHKCIHRQQMRQMDMEAANKNRKWNTKRSLAAGVITLVACAVSLGMGRYTIAPYDVLRAIFDVFTGSDTVSDTMRHVVCFVRVPRILGALLCGAVLLLPEQVFRQCLPIHLLHLIR